MDAKFSTNRKFNRMFINILSIFAILAITLPVTPVVSAASRSPFLGHWQAIDVDGSDMGLTIAGRPNGPFQITWKDNYISYCAGEAGILRGTGWLNASDSNLLEADIHLECFTTGASLDFHIAWRYHPTTNTLSMRYSFGPVTIWHRPGRPHATPPALNLRVNYGHDWVESFYEGGHMAWITVTESDGVTVKATAELVTEPKDFWGGETGFQTQPENWVPTQPDILPNDWVFGWVDNGASAQVQIGDINGMIDLAADSIEGTIYGPWFSNAVNVECFPWGAPEPTEMKFDTTLPNGNDTYSCSWAGEWDIQTEQTVGVGYFGPDGNWVANAFVVPYHNPRIIASTVGDWFWTTGFMPNASLTLSIYDSQAPGAALKWTGDRDADESGFVLVGYSDTSIDLVPGNYVVISDGMFVKGLVLEWITVDIFDIALDFMSGTAPVGRDVWVAAGPQEWQTGIWVTADPGTGAWTADFTTISFDITEEMQPWSYAQIFDEDGDANEADPPPLDFWVAAYTYDAGTWTEGPHTYHFEAERGGGTGRTDEISFTVSNDGQLFDGYVLLGGFAIRANIDGVCPVIDPFIRLDQLTRFHLGYVTDYPMTYAEAQAVFDSLSERAVWDGGISAELERHEIIPYSSDTWPAYRCSFTAPQ